MSHVTIAASYILWQLRASVHDCIYNYPCAVK